MKTIRVRDVPDDLYQRIHTIASSKNRSINTQVITLLSQAVEAEKRRVEQAKALTSIQQRRFKPPNNAPASLELLQEDCRRANGKYY